MQRSAGELRDMLEQRDARGMRLFLEESHPGNVAESLAQLEPAEIVQALRYVRKGDAAEIFEFFSEETQAAIFDGFARKEMAEFLEEMAPDDRADLVKRLNPEIAEGVLPLLAQVDREDIRRLCSYREGTAGAVMTTDYACVPADITVLEALEQVRIQAPDRETIYYVYVVDEERRLLGLAELKDLIVARPAAHKTVRDVMERDVVSVRISDDPVEVAHTISKYDLIAVPGVDAAHRLVGIVTVDDAMDILDPGADEPSAGGAERAAASVLGYVDRAAWATNRPRGLLLLIPALLMCGIWLVLGAGEARLALLGLGLVLPVVVSVGVAPGARCGVSTSRDLVRERPVSRSVLSNLMDEVRFGLPPALVFLVVLGLVLGFRPGAPVRGESGLLILMFVGSVTQIVAAGLLGGVFSIVAMRLGLPVEKMVAPWTLSVADALGVLLYFGLVGPRLVGFVG